MYRHTEAFVNFCRDNFSQELGALRNTAGYQSLSACVLDCVYSLQAKYFSTTIPTVDRYAAIYMGNDRFAAGDTLSNLIDNIETVGPRNFAANVLQNKQISGKVLKADVCLQLSKYLRYLGIDTIADFKNFECPELLEVVIHSVKGMGDAGTNYLFMLAGDSNRCKPDVHVHHCIKDACGEKISNEDCQILFTETVAKLKDDYPNLTVAQLDGIIWNKYQSAKRK